MSRASPRYPVRLAATVHVEKARSAADDMLLCRTRNISREGCLLDTAHALERGTPIEITIMDDQSGDAISMSARVARTVTSNTGQHSGIGVQIPDPPAAWLTLVERQTQQAPAGASEVRGSRQSIVVVGDEDRRRGALALYVTSGWDIRFATDFAGAREALASGDVDAIIAEHDLGDERWPPLMELARELQPRARRLVRARLSGRKRPAEQGFRSGLVHRFVDQNAGLDALLDALTASFVPQPERDASSLQVKLMGLDKSQPPPTTLAGPPLAESAARELLERVIRGAERAAPKGVIVFDIDSTLLDNRPRQAKILREYGLVHDVPELVHCSPEHWQGWDFRVAMANAGLSHAAIAEHEEAYKSFWFERFFTSEYCTVDRPIAGAPAYVAAVANTGSRVVYVTGRPETMREGTLQCLGPAGFPAPNVDRVQLVMKASLRGESDDDYKARTHDRLRELGTLIAAFDNEPAHINAYQRAFPDAICVHLATDHSPRPIRVADGIPSITDFAAYAAEPAPER